MIYCIHVAYKEAKGRRETGDLMGECSCVEDGIVSALFHARKLAKVFTEGRNWTIEQVDIEVPYERKRIS